MKQRQGIFFNWHIIFFNFPVHKQRQTFLKPNNACSYYWDHYSQPKSNQQWNGGSVENDLYGFSFDVLYCDPLLPGYSKIRASTILLIMLPIPTPESTPRILSYFSEVKLNTKYCRKAQFIRNFYYNTLIFKRLYIFFFFFGKIVKY